MTIDIYNSAPYADDDSYMLTHDTTLNQSGSGGVLDNDWDYDEGDAYLLTVSWYSSPDSGGALLVNADGSFDYTPPAGWVGPDYFSYLATDGVEQSNMTLVSIDVTNSAPVAVDDPNWGRYQTLLHTPLIVAAPELLSNDTDADNDTPRETRPDLGPANGTLTYSDTTGGFEYTASVGYSGPDSFTYYAHDGLNQSDAPATVAVNVLDTEGLLSGANGNCNAWAGLLHDVLGTQGIGSTRRGIAAMESTTPNGPFTVWMAIQKWTFTGTMTVPEVKERWVKERCMKER